MNNKKNSVRNFSTEASARACLFINVVGFVTGRYITETVNAASLRTSDEVIYSNIRGHCKRSFSSECVQTLNWIFNSGLCLLRLYCICADLSLKVNNNVIRRIVNEASLKYGWLIDLIRWSHVIHGYVLGRTSGNHSLSETYFLSLLCITKYFSEHELHKQ